jgi:hypothetical protein
MIAVVLLQQERSAVAIAPQLRCSPHILSGQWMVPMFEPCAGLFF